MKKLFCLSFILMIVLSLNAQQILTSPKINSKTPITAKSEDINKLSNSLFTKIELNNAAVGVKSNLQTQADSIKNVLTNVPKLSDAINPDTRYYTKTQIDSILLSKFGNLQLTGSKLTYVVSGNKYTAKTDSVENLGAELVTNGGFANGTGWDNYYNYITFTGGVAQINTGSTTYDAISYQTIGITNSKTYKVKISITAYTSGELVIGLGDQYGAKSTPMTATGDYTFIITANQATPLQVILIVWDVPFVGSIDNISVKEVL